MHKQLESNLERMKLNSIAHALCTEGFCAVRMPTARWVNCERGCPPFCPNQQKPTHSLTIAFRIYGWAVCSVCYYQYDQSSIHLCNMYVCWFCDQLTGHVDPSLHQVPEVLTVDTFCFEGAMEIVIVPFSSSFIILLRPMWNWRDF